MPPEPRRRAEKALVAEAYLAGISTRWMEVLVQQLWIGRISKSQVSECCKSLDETVEEFHSRPLDAGPTRTCDWTR
ncbi:MAG: transposase [Candidatus Dormibacteria bacterium]